MTDPRAVNLFKTVTALPNNSTIIYRHFGATNKSDIAARLRQLSFAHGHQFLIGKDAPLAIECGADGLHLPEADMRDAKLWKRRCPDWILTAAAHEAQSLKQAQSLPLDAVTLSPVFPSQSPSAGTPLGVKSFHNNVKSTNVAVFALGGVNMKTAPKLIGSSAAGIACVSGVLD